MEDFSTRLATLSPEKRALLIMRSRNEGLRKPGDRITRRAKRSLYAPVSFAQQGLYFLNQYEPGSTFYNVPLALRVTGDLNVAALMQSLTEIQRRHEILRSTFLTIDRLPIQVVASADSFRVPLIDLRAAPLAAAALERTINQEANRIFDLTSGPLFRAMIWRVSDREHYLLVTTHHILFDGWSLGIFGRELSALYQAFSHGKSSPLAELEIQYSDFAHWQRQNHRAELLEKQLDYWNQQLDGVPALLSLPTDHPRPAVSSARGARASRELSKAVLDGLVALCRQEQATLFMVLLAAFQTLLHRYGGQADICVGTVTAGRDRVEVQKLIGLFVNTLVVRIKMSPKLAFRELIDRVRRVMAEAFANQEAPFDQVVDRLGRERHASHSPLFQTMFVLQHSGPAEWKLGDTAISTVALRDESSKFDLTLAVLHQPEGLTSTFEYRTDLFEPSTIDRMLGHFHVLLAGIVANPDCGLADLPLIPETELRQLEAWSAA